MCKKPTGPLIKAMQVILLLTMSIACNKKPTVGFNVDKSDYSAGESISVTDYSKDVAHYEWTILTPGGQATYLTDPLPNYKIPLLSKDGSYTIALKAYSKHDKKSSDFSRTFLVKTLRGGMGISGKALSQGYSIEVDNEVLGTNLKTAFYADIPVGLRFVKVKSGGKEWTRTLNIVYITGEDWTINY